MTERVSIIIPCYQQGPLLGEAVGSALAQTHRELEIIIVNDGSTDSTRAVAERFVREQSGRVRLINQDNQGQAMAREAGLKAARGDFLVLLDADDLLEKEALAISLGAFRKHPRAAAVAANAWMVGEDGQTVIKGLDQSRLPPWPAILQNNPFGALVGMMVRTETVRQLGGLISTPGCEDWDLWVRMARCRIPFAAARQYVGRYRQTATSHSHKALIVLRSVIKMLDRCVRTDPRLKHFPKAKVAPPIPEPDYFILRNGKVFKSLGLALAGGTDLEMAGSIIHLLAGDRLDVRYASDQLLEGLHFGLALREAKALPEGLPTEGILACLEERMKEAGLGAYHGPIRRELQKTLKTPLRKRSLLARLRDRF